MPDFNRHTSFAGVLALLLILLPLVLTSCGNQMAMEPTVSEPGQGTGSDGEKRNVYMPESSQDRIQAYLAMMWELSNHDQWDVISGTINPLVGGTISGVPASWPAGYEFSLVIPPNSISERHEVPVDPLNRDNKDITPIQTPITISIHVPLNNDENLPPVYKLEPHGLIFTQPVQVTLCFPPWRTPKPQYAKYYFWQESEQPPLYMYSDLEWVYPAGEDERLAIEFETYHFSRWGLENGNGGEEDLIFDDSYPPYFPLPGWVRP